MTPPSVSPRLRAVVISVGDELLLGRTVDTNAAWLSRRLADVGVPVVWGATVADDAAEIGRVLRSACREAELVVLTGGLGPTPDDLTRDVAADVLGAPLVSDPEVLERIRVRFRDAGRSEVPAANHRVALVPRGATKFANSHGTAPGLLLEHDTTVVVLLPGVPREMQAIVDGALVPWLVERWGDQLETVHTREIHTTGIPESDLAGQVERILSDGTGPVAIAFLPDRLGVDLRLTLRGGDASAASEAFGHVERALASVLDSWRYESPSGDLAEAVTNALRRRGLELAVAESCTGGLIAKRMSDRAGASDVFAGGVVAYANRIKTSMLGVPSGMIETHGAVSESVAESMARGVAARFDSGAGVAVTGIAGPGGGSEAKPVGTVCYASCVGGAVEVRTQRFPGDRVEVRERSAQAALHLLLRQLENAPDAPLSGGDEG